jgi:nitrite reductase/ring-hydroxylating ferredoxin subunit
MAPMRTAKTNEITPGTIREFHVEGKAIAVANVDGKFYAINNTCLHRGGPLGQGSMSGKVVTWILGSSPYHIHNKWFSFVLTKYGHLIRLPPAFLL